MSDDEADQGLRTQIVAIARSWIGTPYRHQASLKGAGADCLGLVRGVYRELYGAEPETAPPYTPDWGEADGCELMMAAAGRHLRRASTASMQAGDVLLFRMRASSPVKHAAIFLGDGRMAHAYAGRGVCEAAFNRWWRARLAAVFAFPGAD